MLQKEVDDAKAKRQAIIDKIQKLSRQPEQAKETEGGTPEYPITVIERPAETPRLSRSAVKDTTELSLGNIRTP